MIKHKGYIIKRDDYWKIRFENGEEQSVYWYEIRNFLKLDELMKDTYLPEDDFFAEIDSYIDSAKIYEWETIVPKLLPPSKGGASGIKLEQSPASLETEMDIRLFVASKRQCFTENAVGSLYQIEDMICAVVDTLNDLLEISVLLEPESGGTWVPAKLIVPAITRTRFVVLVWSNYFNIGEIVSTRQFNGYDYIYVAEDGETEIFQELELAFDILIDLLRFVGNGIIEIKCRR